MNRIHQTPWTKQELELKDEIASVYTAFHNGGMDPSGMKLSIQDAINTPMVSMSFKRVITEVMQEAIEPDRKSVV